MVTDTAFLRNPHDRQPTDTIDTLDLDFTSKSWRGLAGGCKNLDITNT